MVIASGGVAVTCASGNSINSQVTLPSSVTRRRNELIIRLFAPDIRQHGGHFDARQFQTRGPMLRIVVELLAPLRHAARLRDLGRKPIGRLKFQSFRCDVAERESAQLLQAQRPRDIVADLIVEAAGHDRFGGTPREAARACAGIPRPNR